uniref:Inner centromere protein ARK-binding domain-containing protein n=1 Tax=Parascaris univalens TaxID=6257 RepID=A0A914ZKK9_PARUN
VQQGMYRSQLRRCPRMAATRREDEAWGLRMNEMPDKESIGMMLAHLQLEYVFDRILDDPFCSQIFMNCDRSYGWLHAMTNDCIEIMHECGTDVSKDVLQDYVKGSFEGFIQFLTKRDNEANKRLQFTGVTPTNPKTRKVYRKTPRRGIPMENDQIEANRGDSAKKINEASGRRERLLEEKAERVRRDREDRAQRVAYNRKKQNERKQRLNEKCTINLTSNDVTVVESTPVLDMVNSMKQKDCELDDDERQVVSDSLQGSILLLANEESENHGENPHITQQFTPISGSYKPNPINETQNDREISMNDYKKGDYGDDTVEIFTPKATTEKVLLVASYLSSSSSERHRICANEKLPTPVRNDSKNEDTTDKCDNCPQKPDDIVRCFNEHHNTEEIEYLDGANELGEAPMEIDISEVDYRRANGDINDETPITIDVTAMKFDEMNISESKDDNSKNEQTKQPDATCSSSNDESSCTSSTFNNYGITDLSSSDETDPEESPKKLVPSWAQGIRLRQAVRQQRLHPPIDIDEFFGRVEVPRLGELFMRRKSCISVRSASGLWESPISNPRIGKSAIERAAQGMHDFNHTIHLQPYHN